MSVDLAVSMAQMYAYVHGCQPSRTEGPCQGCTRLAQQTVKLLIARKGVRT